MLTLYDYYRSSACYRVRIALNLKNLSYDVVPVHLLNNGGEQFSATYLALNPQALVPSLMVDENVLTQSLAIIEYLDETHPAPALLPDNPLLKAKVRAFAMTIAADIHPLNNLRVVQYLTEHFKMDETQKLAWFHHWMRKGFSALEQQLVKNKSNGDFCFGATPTLADICLVPQLYNARRFQCDVSDFPTLCRIDQHCQQLTAFKNAQPLTKESA